MSSEEEDCIENALDMDVPLKDPESLSYFVFDI